MSLRRRFIQAYLLKRDREQDRPWQLLVDGVPLVQRDGTAPRITPLTVKEINNLGMAGIIERVEVYKVRLILGEGDHARLRPEALYAIAFSPDSHRRCWLKDTRRSRLQGAWTELILEAGNPLTPP